MDDRILIEIYIWNRHMITSLYLILLGTEAFYYFENMEIRKIKEQNNGRKLCSKFLRSLTFFFKTWIYNLDQSIVSMPDDIHMHLETRHFIIVTEYTDFIT